MQPSWILNGCHDIQTEIVFSHISVQETYAPVTPNGDHPAIALRSRLHSVYKIKVY